MVRNWAGQLTPRQMSILRFIRDYQHRKGYAPTLQEVADHLGVSKVTVFEHFENLRRKGLLRRRRHAARSVELSQAVRFPDEVAARLPLVGYIAAGSPIEAIEDRQSIDVGELFGRSGQRFALRVRGESMIDEQIRDGDYVIVERRAQVREGQTVVALLPGGEATLKKFYRRGRQIRLEPANPAFEPIELDAQEVQIQGVVIGVVRRY